MHDFLTFLAGRTSTPWTRYGFVIGTLSAITLFRVFVPLDAAPFLLYLPVVFLLSVAFGTRTGYVAMGLSSVAAACFFSHPGTAWWALTTPQWVAVFEFLLVVTAMVRVCGALRKAVFDNQASLALAMASEGRLRTIVDTVPVGIMFAEAPSGQIVSRNKRMEDIVGGVGEKRKSLEDYGKWQSFHGDGRRVEAREYPLAKVIRGEADGASLQIHYQRRDGSRIWIDLVAAATRDADGRLTGAVVAATDVDARKTTELRQAEMTEELRRRKDEAEAATEAAQAANRAKSAFLANMSHELRTPLSAVIGYTELLEEEAEEAHETAMLVDLGKIKANAKHLLSLINDVLDLSKVEANKMEIFPESIELGAFVDDVAATMDSLVRQKANTLSLDLGEGLGTIVSDHVKLRQCLFNLLGNACKFTENGRITLRVRRETSDGTDWLRFAVEDTGIGMTPDQLQRLFQRFSQADESTTRKFGGTGLGLALTRAFAKLLGGDVTVTSTEGVGTCFTLLVPAVASKPSVEHGSQGAGHELSTDDGRRGLILVIDDEASQRELLARFLRKQQFEVRTAADGRAGIAIAKSLIPHVILLDVMMPDLDGWSVLKALKADPITGDIPVVIVSFIAEPTMGLSLGAVDTVAKPVDWTKLKAILDTLKHVEGTVLVVDDDIDTRQRLRIVLERNGWSVQEAGDGAEALECVRLSHPSLILLDLTMPVMDGFEFLHRLRETPNGADISVVVLSARDISTAERSKLVDADRILRKDTTSMRDLTSELRVLRGSALSTEDDRKASIQ